jgi:hypothetical protein
MADGYKTGGRQAGTPNKATTEFRQAVTQLLTDNGQNLNTWLQRVADGDGDNKPDPGKALDLLAKLAEYAAPKLARTEHVGDAEQPVKLQFEWLSKE